MSLLILKRIYNFGDETIIDQCLQNPYMQYFSGEKTFRWEFPCDSRDLVYFRIRIRKEEVEKIFKISIDIHENAGKEKEISIRHNSTGKKYYFSYGYQIIQKDL